MRPHINPVYMLNIASFVFEFWHKYAGQEPCSNLYFAVLQNNGEHMKSKLRFLFIELPLIALVIWPLITAYILLSAVCIAVYFIALCTVGMLCRLCGYDASNVTRQFMRMKDALDDVLTSFTDN